MKLKTLLLLLVTSTLLFACNQANNPTSNKNITPKNFADSISYAYGYTIGMNIIKNLIDDSIDVNFDLIALGIKNSILEDPEFPMMSKDVVDSIMMQLQMMEMEKQEQKRAERQLQFEDLEKNSAADAKSFFEENKSKPGIKVDKPNIHYRILTDGTGNKPIDGDLVKINIIGKILNGEEIMNTLDRGGPLDFQLGANMGSPDMENIIKKMNAGAKWEIFWPCKLVYGDNGIPGMVPPDAVIVWEIELNEIVKPE